MVAAASAVILPLLFFSSPDPTTVKWFSVSLKCRAVGLAEFVHGLLGRAWALAFRGALQEANVVAELDDANHDSEDYSMLARKRHRKVAEFFSRPHFCAVLLSSLACIREMEQLQVNLLCWDSTRKGQSKRKRDEKRIPM